MTMRSPKQYYLPLPEFLELNKQIEEEFCSEKQNHHIVHNFSHAIRMIENERHFDFINRYLKKYNVFK